MKVKINLTIITLIFLSAILFNSISIPAQGLTNSPTITDKSKIDEMDQAFITASGFSQDASLAEIVSAVIKVFLSLLGVIFIILIIYAGMLWMTSAGNEEKISKAKKIMISAFIGLTIVISAYAITYFVIDRILEATAGGTGLD